MKKTQYFSEYLILTIILLLFSCGENNTTQQEEPDVISEIISSLYLSSEINNETISFTTNKKWTASLSSTQGDKSWCTIFPTNGNAGSANIKVNTTENTEYDDRSVILTIRSGKTVRNINITQKQKNTIVISKNDFEVSEHGGIIEVETLTNIDLEVLIPENIDWVHQQKQTSGTKALTNTKITFKIDKNINFRSRACLITINDSENTIKETITLKQEGISEVNLTTPGTLNSLFTEEEKQNIEKLTISGTLNEYDILTLKQMLSLKYLNMTNVNNTILPNRAFENNQTINEILLPEGLQEIPEYLFYRSRVTKCDLPENIKIIGDYSFYYTPIKGTLRIPSSVQKIGKSAFYGCPVSELILNEGLIKIDTEAFYLCISIGNELTIPSTVARIEHRAFAFCMNITGVLVIPSSVKYIGEGAFASMSKITGLVLNEGLEHLEGAFGNSELIKMKNLILPSTLLFIGRDTFWGCSHITGSLFIPKSVKSIGAGSFFGTGLDKVYCESQIPPTIMTAWNPVNPLFKESNYLGVPTGSKDAYRNAPFWKDFLIIEEVDFDNFKIGD